MDQEQIEAEQPNNNENNNGGNDDDGEQMENTAQDNVFKNYSVSLLL